MTGRERYACPPVDRIWSDSASLARRVRVWGAASAAVGHPFDLDDEPEGFDTLAAIALRARELEATVGHDLFAQCEALRGWLAGPSENADAAAWLHYGLCSSDVVDADWLLAFAELHRTLRELVGDARDAITYTGESDPGNGVSDLPVMLRTHGRPAHRATIAQWRDGHAYRLMRARAAAGSLIPEHVGFAGPVGTGGRLTYDQRVKIASALGLGLRNEDGRQASDRTAWAAYLTAIARIATTCAQFATDVRLWAATGEAVEEDSPTRIGSSSMPHKNNPTRCERIAGLAALARGVASGYEEAASSCWGAHSLEHSSAERVAFPLVTGLVGFVLTETAGVAGTVRFGAELGRVAWNDGQPLSYDVRNDLIEAGVDGGEAHARARAKARLTGLSPS